MASNHHFAYNPRSARTITVHVGGSRRPKAFNNPSHSGFHGGLIPALKTFHRSGTAHPRYPILRVNPTKR